MVAESQQPDPPDTAAWQALESVFHAFEQAWRRGDRPPIEDYLPAGAGRGRALRELAQIDLEFRLKAGETARVEDYLVRYPELAHVPAFLDLLATEFMLRRRSETDLTAQEYLARFPQYREEVLARLRALADRDTGEHGATEPPLGPAVRDSSPTPAFPPEPRSGRSAIGPSSPAYEVLGEVGRGGMGIVYRAHDRQRHTVVALKTLPRLEPAALYHFKQEFRALADVVHPNLVNLYELIADGQQWFFSMEFVEGVDFLTYARVGCQVSDVEPTRHIRKPVPVAGTAAPARAGPAPLSPEGLGRLRDALRQLAAGVQALHDAGKLHRDIKPSNILVTPTGRVVLLDFGLVAELDRAGQCGTAEPGLAGTVAYMAPEQAADLALSPASDWYSVGALLYQVLTGHPPFHGSTARVLHDKQHKDPPPPSALAPGVPEDLDALCVALLARQPERRPSGREVLRQLGSPAGAPLPVAPVRLPSTMGIPFVGRERHLRVLREALHTVQGRRAAVVHVRGRSGVGKSALVQRFLEEVIPGGEVVLLAGRCYEHESVPYKALDSLVDALSRYLRRIPEGEAENLVPTDVWPLARIFPVLRGVPAVARAPRGTVEAPEPHELRRRAFAALRELLARLGQRRQLVLAIDDLQWGDADSAALLAELLQPPDPPVFLLVGSYRSEDENTSPFLRALLAAPKGLDSAPDRQVLAIEPLTPEETRELALHLLGRDDPSARAQADAVVRESGGNPFFAAELVQHLQSGGGPTRPAPAAPSLSLDRVLWERIARLPDEARRLLEVAAVHGRPLRQGEAWAATSLQTDERPALAVLCSGRLLRSTGASARDEIETYHDRVRETVVAHLAAPARARIHASLARTLEASGQVEPEVLAVHLLGAGDSARAGHYYAVAAAQAAEALAFERAAKLYRLALNLVDHEPAEQRRLRTELGHALANAGRGAEAAPEYLKAAQGETGLPAIDLRRQAAHQFLISGHHDEGIAVIRDVLGAVGSRLARTPRRAFWSLLLHRLRLRLRGLRFRVRAACDIRPEDLTRLHLYRTVWVALALIDNIRGAEFGTRHLLLALRVGDPYHLALGLASEAAVLASEPAQHGRAAQLLQAARELARPLADPYVTAFITLIEAYRTLIQGRWRQALGLADQAAKIFRERCRGVSYELSILTAYQFHALFYLGEVAELARRLPPLLAEAEERGKVFDATLLRVAYTSTAWLAADDPEGARREVRAALARWSVQGFHTQHYWALLAEAESLLYTGDGCAAWELVQARWPALRASRLLRNQQFEIAALDLRARCAVARAAAEGGAGRLPPVVARDLRTIERKNMPWSNPLAQLLRAGLAALRQDHPAAETHLAAAAAGFEAAEMALHAAACRWRQGQLLGGTRGLALVRSAADWMRGQRIRCPERFVTMLAPGFPPIGQGAGQGGPAGRLLLR